jgi:UPF0755 protein
MYRRLRIAIAFLIVILICFLGFSGALWWKWANGPKLAGGEGKLVRVTVAKGATVVQVGEELEQQGLIRSAQLFRWIGRDSTLKPGVYEFRPNETPAGILRRLEKGDIATVKVTFPEGFTLRRMADRLAREGMIASPDGFLKLVTEQGDSQKADFPLPKNLEGYLFPETYRFPVGVDERAIAQEMLANFERRVVDGLDAELKKSRRSLAEVVNVAAMIEKEAEADEDRPLIAGVIYNRLKKGMRLQIDATVQYARGVHEKRLLFSHLEVDSPYNTYKHAGLPAGPICNPGLPSLEAAITPKPSNYLFYVYAQDGTGRHLFAPTYEEHLKNVAIFKKRRAEAEKRKKAEQGTAPKGAL